VGQLPVDPILRVLADHWDSVTGELPGPDLDRFRGLVERVSAAATAADREDATDELIDFLMRALRRDHVVRRAIADSARFRSAQALADPPDAPGREPGEEAVLAELRRLLDAVRETPEAILRAAEARLLAAPAVSAAELRARGGDPEQAHLISLAGPDGPRLPVFQFDAMGRPLPVVLGINALLDAGDDPWGVADWWLGRNAWLGQAPAESLGRIADDVLLAAARAIVGGE
jgi:hypothetical protein